MIEIINIIPKKYLYIPDPVSSFFPFMYIAMAHLVLEDKEYCGWFKNQKNKGKYIILDNSAPYFGGALDDDSLLKCIDEIKPDEIILPDVINNFKETTKRSLRFLSKIKRIKNLKIMAVPQGSSIDEYVECYNLFSSKVAVIGLSYSVDNLFSDLSPSKGYVNSRDYLMKLLIKRGGIDISKEHHLLGFGDSGHIELGRLREFSFIRSCDSNIAYITAKQNIEIIEGVPYKKPKIPMNFDDDFDDGVYKLFLKNVKTLARIGSCKND